MGHILQFEKMKKNRKWDIQFGDNVLDVSVVRVPYAWQLSHAVKGAVLTTSPAPAWLTDDLTVLEMSSSPSFLSR